MALNSSAYPYTGGVYGGYRDPDNNKAATVIGPKKADPAVKGAVNPLVAGAMDAYRKYSQGVSGTLSQTSEAYKQGGIGSAAGQYVRGTLGDAGNALVQGVAKPVMGAVVKPALSLSGGIANFGKTLLTGDPTPIDSQSQPQKNPLAVMPKLNPGSAGLSQQDVSLMPSHKPAPEAAEAHLKENVHLAPQFQKKYGYLPKGINYSQGADGSRTLTMGTPGQDGYGKMVVHPGTARTALATMPTIQERTPTSLQTKQVGGMTITGSPEDVERFSRPVGMTGPATGKQSLLTAPPEGAQSWSDWYDGLGDAYDKRVGVAPKANAAKGPSMNELTKGLDGLGWKTRQAIILQRMKGADDVNIETLREAGADRRMALAQGVELEKFKGENDIARGNLDTTRELNQARIGTEQINQQKGKAEVEALNQIKAARDAYTKNPTPENESIYRALIGKFEREAQYGTVDRHDDTGAKIGQDIYNKQTGELRAGSGQSEGDRIYPQPTDSKQLVKGRIYLGPQGAGMWNGTHFDTKWWTRKKD